MRLSFINCKGNLTERDRKNSQRFNSICFAWALVYMASAYFIQAEYFQSAWVKGLLVILPTLISCLACQSYLRFLRQTDELNRKIQLEGLALGFGIGMIFLLSYALCKKAGAPDFGETLPILALSGGWILGQIQATRRYR